MKAVVVKTPKKLRRFLLGQDEEIAPVVMGMLPFEV